MSCSLCLTSPKSFSSAFGDFCTFSPPSRHVILTNHRTSKSSYVVKNKCEIEATARAPIECNFYAYVLRYLCFARLFTIFNLHFGHRKQINMENSCADKMSRIEISLRYHAQFVLLNAQLKDRGLSYFDWHTGAWSTMMPASDNRVGQYFLTSVVTGKNTNCCGALEPQSSSSSPGRIL